MSHVVGIDLGTTNSVVAVMKPGGPQVVENRDAKRQMRSVVGLKRQKKKGDIEEVLVGDAAMDQWAMAPKDTVVSVKRLMGRGFADPEVQKVRARALYSIVEPSKGTRDGVRVLLGGKEQSPAEISALILKKLKADAEHRLGGPVSRAVITVPAYFSQAQKAETRKAAQLAGLEVIKLLDEPTAAAIAFGIDTESAGAKNVLVFDLGGGTFDISVLMVAANTFVPLNLEGDMWLGGDNFDQVLVDHALAEVKREHGIDVEQWSDATRRLRFLAELKKAAQSTKERLSSSRSASLVVAGHLQNEEGDLVDLDLDITREIFEDRIRSLVERAMMLTRKAVENAKLTYDEIDHVVLAGNSSSIPAIQAAIEREFGAPKVLRTAHPKECVALGAVKVASWIEGVVCQAPRAGDPTKECGQPNPEGAKTCQKCGAPLESGETTGLSAMHYGTQSAGDRFNVFVRKGDPIPTSDAHAQTFRTQMPGQRVVCIPMFGGGDLEKASANTSEGVAYAVLPPGLAAQSPLRIKLWLDQDGTVAIAAALEGGAPLPAKVIKGDEDARAVEAVLKVEVLLLQKADALSSDERAAVEDGRNQALEAFREEDFDRTYELAVQLCDRLAADPAVEQKARHLLGFAEMLTKYRRAFEPGRLARLEHLTGELRRALASGRRDAIAAATAPLDEATNNLPQMVAFCLTMRGLAVRLHDLPVTPPALQREIQNLGLGSAGDAGMILYQAVEAVEAATDINGAQMAMLQLMMVAQKLGPLFPHVPRPDGRVLPAVPKVPLCSQHGASFDSKCDECREILMPQ
jgi:molecular chaperone DnaK (HSP70)